MMVAGVRRDNKGSWDFILATGDADLGVESDEGVRDDKWTGRGRSCEVKVV